MDPLDALLYRPTLASSPLSLLIRAPDPEALPLLLERCWTLLDRRRTPDEVFLLLTKDPPTRPARCNGRRSVRTVVREDAGGGPAFAWGLKHCRCPIIVTIDSNMAASPAELKSLLKGLDQADLVVGLRKGLGGFDGGRGPAAALLRWIFGAPLTDPLCPIKAIRRAAVEEIILQSTAPLADFELVAKMTFLTSLLDEVPLEASRNAAPTLGGAFFKDWRELRRLWDEPRFWSLQTTEEGLAGRNPASLPFDSQAGASYITHPKGSRAARFRSGWKWFARNAKGRSW